MEVLQKHQALLTNYEVHLLLRDLTKQENEAQRRIGKNQAKSTAAKSAQKSAGSGTEEECASKRERSESQSQAGPSAEVKKREPSTEQDVSTSSSVSQFQTAPNLATICYELQRYLDEVTDCAVLERRNVDASSFQALNDSLRDRFGLTRTELFAIANWLPTTPIDIAALIEDAERRFASDPEQLEQLVGFVRTHLTGSPEDYAALKAEIERERSASKEPAVKSRSPRKQH